MIEFYKSIRNILIEYWDPVNISENQNLHDEYDGYVYRIINLIEKKYPSKKKLYNLLEKIENKEIGLITSDSKRWNTTNKIFSLVLRKIS